MDVKVLLRNVLLRNVDKIPNIEHSKGTDEHSKGTDEQSKGTENILAAWFQSA
jgi:hypothetical protein